jgi:GxxExxY protein
VPITVANPIRVVDQDEFMAIDHEVMKHAFAIHNRYGALCDEKVYNDELAYRCAKAGLTSFRETSIAVTHKSFKKTYYIDVVVGGAAVYELKAVKELAARHGLQLLNYLLLIGAKHGKVMTFGGKSVAFRFISTNLDPTKRHEMEVNTERWVACCERDEKLPAVLSSLVDDWGGFLSVSLYREALTNLLNHDQGMAGEVELLDGDRIVGKQKELLLAPDVIFSVTGASQGIAGLRRHLQRFLHNSSAHAIQWVNFDHHKVTIETLRK